MFKRIDTAGDKNEGFEFSFEDRTIPAKEGDTVAAALIAAGVLQFRDHPVSHDPRGPYCLMGACFECLVNLNGKTVQACMTPATPNMKITRSRAPDKKRGGSDDDL